MFGAIAKSYFAEKIGISRNDLVVVSIMPCLAKKYECQRDEFSTDNNRDVDFSLSTRELAAFIKQANIDLKTLEEGEFDAPLGDQQVQVLFLVLQVALSRPQYAQPMNCRRAKS
jgi:NADP-reducing hydrogenase subunit HndD